MTQMQKLFKSSSKKINWIIILNHAFCHKNANELDLHTDLHMLIKMLQDSI